MKIARSIQHTTTAVIGAMLIVTAGMANSVSAANLYQPETTPSRMFNVVKPVVGDLVTPIFLIGDDSGGFSKYLDPIAVEAAGVDQGAFAYYESKIQPDSIDHQVRGYAIGGIGSPGNEVENRTCAIVLSNRDQMKTTRTMFHEAVHCKNFSELRKAPDSWRLAVSMNTPELGMTDDQFMSMFHEVLAAYIQVAYNANDGIEDGLGMIMTAAEANSNSATSIGYRTARNAIFLCAKKDGCSTYSPDVIEMINKDHEAKTAMLLDVKELYDAAKLSGFVVSDAVK